MMELSDLMMLSSSGIRLLNYIHQIRHTKHKKSVYGVSTDFIILTWVSYATSVLSSGFYLINTQVIDEYVNRFPFYSEIYVSNFLFVSDTIGIIVVGGLLMQSFVVYKMTRSKYQGISSMCISFVGLQLTAFLWLLYHAHLGNKRLFFLDVIDYIWFVSKLNSAIRLLPQITVNWTIESVLGLHTSFMKYEWTSTAFLALAKISMNNNNWYKIPVNYDSWITLIVHILLLAIFQLQKDYLYCRP